MMILGSIVGILLLRMMDRYLILKKKYFFHLDLTKHCSNFSTEKINWWRNQLKKSWSIQCLVNVLSTCWINVRMILRFYILCLAFIFIEYLSVYRCNFRYNHTLKPMFHILSFVGIIEMYVCNIPTIIKLK